MPNIEVALEPKCRCLNLLLLHCGLLSKPTTSISFANHSYVLCFEDISAVPSSSSRSNSEIYHFWYWFNLSAVKCFVVLIMPRHLHATMRSNTSALGPKSIQVCRNWCPVLYQRKFGRHWPAVVLGYWEFKGVCREGSEHEHVRCDAALRAMGLRSKQRCILMRQ
jgi:hypothetical protein